MERRMSLIGRFYLLYTAWREVVNPFRALRYSIRTLFL